mgnify:CR=1 FL=1
MTLTSHIRTYQENPGNRRRKTCRKSRHPIPPLFFCIETSWLLRPVPQFYFYPIVLFVCMSNSATTNLSDWMGKFNGCWQYNFYVNCQKPNGTMLMHNMAYVWASCVMGPLFTNQINRNHWFIILWYRNLNYCT